MLVCMWYTELTCIPDVWPSGHYGSGPWLCVSVCVRAETVLKGLFPLHLLPILSTPISSTVINFNKVIKINF